MTDDPRAGAGDDDAPGPDPGRDGGGRMATTFRWLRYGLVAAAAGLALLAAVLLVRTALFRSRQVAPPPLAPVELDEAAAARHLGGAVAIETVSSPDSPADPPPGDPEIAKFTRLHAYLKATFPRARDGLTWETVGGGSLLLTWPGSDPALKPLLLLAHMDVVPAAGDEESAGAGAGAGASDDWARLAFSGKVDDAFIWGRGTLDDKVSVVGILEAVEALLKAGHRPRRTVLMAFGRDEEVGGNNGARRIAALLKQRGVRPECVLDEGSYVLEGVVPGLRVPVAPVGVAEKGYVDVMLSVADKGGHSSMPGPHTAIGVLARAVARVEDHPLPARIDGICGETLDALGPEFPFLPRVLFANRWLFGPVLKAGFTASPPMNALVRTTSAVTLTGGGAKDNVLPSSAWALVNFRLLPGDTSESVLAHVRAAVADPRVKVAFADPVRYSRVFEASKVAPVGTPGYRALERSIRQTYPGAAVVPYLVLAGTDARHYEGLTDGVYRFLPLRITPRDLERIHGADERIARKDFADAVQFYARLIRNADPPPGVGDGPGPR